AKAAGGSETSAAAIEATNRYGGKDTGGTSGVDIIASSTSAGSDAAEVAECDGSKAPIWSGSIDGEQRKSWAYEPLRLAALRTSSTTCTLCAMILYAALRVRDDISAKHNGERRGAWITFSPASRGIVDRRFEETVGGRFLAGTNMATGAFSDSPPQKREYAKKYPFASDDAVRPYLFGSWWIPHEFHPSVLPQLVGFGVRLGTSPEPEDGEGNQRNVPNDKGELQNLVTYRGTFLRLRTRFDSPFASIIPGRLISKDSSSFMAIEKIRSWLDNCDTHHICCPKDTLLPYRVVDVDTAGSRWERYLSRRAVHFCADQMYFECNMCTLAEDGSVIAPHNNLHLIALRETMPFEKHGLGSATGTSFIEGYPPFIEGDPIGLWNDGWLAVVQDYSQRDLTVNDDKLNALSGLANRLANLTGDEYLAGIWKSHIFEDLFWRVRSREEVRKQVPGGFEHSIGKTLCTPKRAANYRAPTWSWACLDDAHIDHIPLDYSRLVASLVSASTAPSGILIMRGPLLTLRKAPANYKPDPTLPLGFGIFMTAQTAGGLSYGEIFFDITSEARDECLGLFLDPSNCILLTPAPGGKYKRIGIGKFLRTEEQMKSNPMYDPDRKPALIFTPYGPVTQSDVVTSPITII
ncbi:hypothetical protein HK405_013961, partial [Cladochytrium tenue]